MWHSWVLTVLNSCTCFIYCRLKWASTRYYIFPASTTALKSYGIAKIGVTEFFFKCLLVTFYQPQNEATLLLLITTGVFISLTVLNIMDSQTLLLLLYVPKDLLKTNVKLCCYMFMLAPHKRPYLLTRLLFGMHSFVLINSCLYVYTWHKGLQVLKKVMWSKWFHGLMDGFLTAY